MAGYTGLKDMFDGGGAGQSGARFEGGGILSAIGNAVARPAGSRDRGESDQRTGLGGLARDAVNGGGWGNSGETFSGGGGWSALANMFGARPMGYEERSGQAMRDAMAKVAAQAAMNRSMAGVANYGAPTANAPFTSPRPPQQVTGPMLPTSLPTVAQGGPQGMLPPSQALYGANVPLGGFNLPPAVPAPAPAPADWLQSYISTGKWY